MAYSTSNPPALVTKRVGASGGIWVYKDGDSVATANGINYITNAAKLGMKAGDVVFHIDETNLTTTQMSVITGATTGTASGATGSAIEPIGETSIAVSAAGTGTILAGDVVTFGNGDETEYLVTTGVASVAAGGTMVITPGLVVATAVGTPIKVKTTVLNLTEGAVSNKLISGVGATKTLTKADAGATCLFDRAAGNVYTLPTPVPGMKFRFVQTVSVTSNASTVNSGSASIFFVGNVNQIIDASATSEGQVANGTTHIGMASNGSTTGGLIGSWTEFEALSSTLWLVRGIHVGSGALATPFTT